MTDNKYKTKFDAKFLHARAVLDRGDFNEIEKNLWNFQDLYMEINRHLERFIKTDVNNLHICAGDIKDLCDLTLPLLLKYERQINHDDMHAALFSGKHKHIDDKVFKDWCVKYTKIFSVVAKLRNCLSIWSYAYCVLDAYERQWEQNNDMNVILTMAIKDYLKYGY